jgi:hypothetical protein
MPLYNAAAAPRKPDSIYSSSGTAFDGGWRSWWRAEAERTNTDWESLHRQHVAAWRALRSRAEPFATGLSTYAPGTAP